MARSSADQSRLSDSRAPSLSAMPATRVASSMGRRISPTRSAPRSGSRLSSPSAKPLKLEATGSTPLASASISTRG